MDVIIPKEFTTAVPVYNPINTNRTFSNADGKRENLVDGFYEPVFERYAGANLLLKSEQMTDTDYWKQNGTMTITDGQPSFDGSNTAFELDDSDAGSAPSLLNEVPVQSGETTQTFSVYFKAGTATVSTIRLAFTDTATTTNYNLIFDPIAATVTSVTVGATGGIERDDNDSAGWYRVWITAPKASAYSATCRIFPASTTAANTGTIFYNGAQYNTGELADYIPNSSGSEPALALEHGVLIDTTQQQFDRENLLLWSEDMTNASWVQAGTGTVTQTGTSPSGEAASELVDTDTSANLMQVRQDVTIPDDSTSYVFSLFVKGGTLGRSGLVVQTVGGTTVTSSLVMNFITGEIIALTATFFTLERWGDGWWRVSIAVANNSTGNTVGRCYFRPFDDVGGTGTIYTGGAMLEEQYFSGDPPSGYVKSEASSSTSFGNASPTPQGTFPAAFLYSNVPRQEFTEWTAGAYNLGDRTQQNYRIYEVTADPSTTDEPEVGALLDPPTWVDAGAANFARAIDYDTGSTNKSVTVESTLNTEGCMHLCIGGQRGPVSGGFFCNGMGLLGVQGSRAFVTIEGEATIEINLPDGSGNLINLEKTPEANIYISIFGKDFAPYVSNFSPVTDFQSRIGKIILGDQVYIGKTENVPQVRLIDLSKNTRDLSGNVVKVQGATYVLADYKVRIETGNNAQTLNFFDLLSSTASLGTLFIGDPDRNETVLFGYSSNFKINSSVSSVSPSDIQVTGL